jgi:hypothetical protein
MDPISAHDGLTSAYRILTELGGFVGGVLALIAGLLAYAAGARQARATGRAADEQIAAMRVQMEGLKRTTDDADERRREDLRFALAREAARIGEFVAHRYRVIPMEYGPGKLETIARSACETFKIEQAVVLRDTPGATALLEKEIIAAAVFLDEKIDEVNSLLAVEGVLGRLPAVGLMTAFENVTDAAQRLRASTMSGADGTSEPDDASPRVAWLRPGTSNRRPAAVGEKIALP